ncbi:MAG: DUF2269 family protein [Lysobacteraceae bacterium]
MEFLLVKTLHILSSTVLFGTGLGTAFFQWMAYRRGEVAAIAVTARHVVLADWLFTTPAIIVQPLTGFWLLHLMGLSWDASWIRLSLGLYALAGACWLPVVWIQYRLRALAEAADAAGAPLPPSYHRLMRLWFALGWPAFAGLVAVFWLMVAKPG